MKINAENIEELIILFIDNELSKQDAASVMNFIASNEKYETLLEQYRAVKLQPEDDADKFVYPDIKALIKPKHENIIQFAPQRKFKTLKWAAAIACILAGYGLVHIVTQEENNLPTHTVAHQTISAKKPEAKLTALDSSKILASTISSSAEADEQLGGKKPSKKTIAKSISRVAQPTAIVMIEQKQNERIATVKLLESNMPQPISTKPSATIINNSNPSRTKPTSLANTTKKGVQNMVDDNRGFLVNDIAQQLEQFKDRIVTTAQDIKETKFVFLYGDKELN